ncbi:MAG: protein translocase subunit SecF, partial [Azoarcus sp.]|nr:protein translocase subunit SecF [Azoarcus sp.]
MEFFRIKKDIPFMRFALIFNIISLVTFIAAVFFLAFRGLHLSVEFTGGTLIEAGYARTGAVTPEVLQEKLKLLRQNLADNGYPDAQVQSYGTTTKAGDNGAPPRTTDDFLIRLSAEKANSGKDGAADNKKDSVQHLKEILEKAGDAEVRRIEFVGPQVGKELASDGAMALLVVIIGIVLYLAMRFEWRFAVSAIIAN